MQKWKKFQIQKLSTIRRAQAGLEERVKHSRQWGWGWVKHTEIGGKCLLFCRASSTFFRPFEPPPPFTSPSVLSSFPFFSFKHSLLLFWIILICRNELSRVNVFFDDGKSGASNENKFWADAGLQFSFFTFAISLLSSVRLCTQEELRSISHCEMKWNLLGFSVFVYFIFHGDPVKIQFAPTRSSDPERHQNFDSFFSSWILSKAKI